MAALLLAGELAQRVVADVAVVAGHAQRAAPLTGHAGEALPPGEVVHRHRVEAHSFPPQRRPWAPEDGGRCVSQTDKDRESERDVRDEREGDRGKERERERQR